VSHEYAASLNASRTQAFRPTRAREDLGMDARFDLGTYGRSVTTSSSEAQRWFDRGLLWCYGYNHEASVRCFERAAELDPDCAMAHWGVAYAGGCNYNRTWKDFAPAELQEVVAFTRRATDAALARLDGASEVERALVRALDSRYQSSEIVSEQAFESWNDAFAAAMAEVYARFPDDHDVATLYAEAMINRTPWLLWDVHRGVPAPGSDAERVIEVLERAMRQVEASGSQPHPGLLHMYVHVMEMSPHPERALNAADALRDLVPDAGHLLHMPSHIDILCGHYADAVRANDRAIAADERYRDVAGDLNFYTLYRVHDYHFKTYAAMFLGNYSAARSAADAVRATVSEELLRVEAPPMADVLESMVTLDLHVLIRFGRWDEILEQPLPDDGDLYCVTHAMLHYAKGIAHAASGNVTAADSERDRFREAYVRIPESRYLFNNTCLDVLAVAAAMLDGEIAYRKGDFAEAFAHLRRSVALDDALAYAEPWGWMQPARHALGALLLEQGRVEEAAAVYRADLGLDDSLSRPTQHPDNVWSLHGYTECLERLGRDAEATASRKRLVVAMARADVTIGASCFCRTEEHRCH
jgi:tetratricopeptide (TPR) repeat protein